MKKVVVLAFLLLIPTLLFLNVRQTVRFEQLRRSVAELERRQDRLLERNKRAIASIEVLTSPRRIEELARTELDLVKIPHERITYLTIRREEGDE